MFAAYAGSHRRPIDLRPRSVGSTAVRFWRSRAGSEPERQHRDIVGRTIGQPFGDQFVAHRIDITLVASLSRLVSMVSVGSSISPSVNMIQVFDSSTTNGLRRYIVRGLAGEADNGIDPPTDEEGLAVRRGSSPTPRRRDGLPVDQTGADRAPPESSAVLA